MSLMDKRNEVVTALQELGYLKPYAVRPPTYKEPGVTWYVQRDLEIDPEAGQYENSFYVVVFMHQDEATAAQWMSDHWREIVDALEPVCYIDSVGLVNLGDSQNSEFAMQLRARSE
jgi:ADP-heptose:LPS heptosyltransferase